jgi:signal transduction histidine kinase
MASLAGCGVGTWALDTGLALDATLLAIWGRTREELGGALGTALLACVHPDDTAHARGLRMFQQPGLTVSPTERMFRVQRPDGSERWVLCREHATEHPAQPGERVSGIVLDLTAWKRDAEAKQRERTLETVSSLAAGLAHDFNNLLFAIMGNAALALGTSDLPEEHPLRESLREIERASVRASDLVQRLGLFSRPPQPRRHMVKLGPLVETAAQSVRAALPPRVQLRTQAAADGLTVLADVKLAEQVVSNLISNAAHAMEGREGSIDLELEEIVLGSQPWFDELEVKPGRYVELRVQDAGIGMDDATRARIFEPFFSTRPKGKAMGLGMCIVQGIVRSHAGAVRVASDRASGTTVHVYWPCA